MQKKPQKRGGVPFEGGRTKSGGRAKGTPNKTTRVLKEALLLAAEVVGEDGKGKDGLVGYLVNVARTEPRSFMPVLAKLLPMQISASVEHEIKDISYQNRGALIDALRKRGILNPELIANSLAPRPMKTIEHKP